MICTCVSYMGFLCFGLRISCTFPAGSSTWPTTSWQGSTRICTIIAEESVSKINLPRYVDEPTPAYSRHQRRYMVSLPDELHHHPSLPGLWCIKFEGPLPCQLYKSSATTTSVTSDTTIIYQTYKSEGNFKKSSLVLQITRIEAACSFK